MKIKLRVDLPLEEKHGMTAGRILEVIHIRPYERNFPRWVVQEDAGEEVSVYCIEAEVVEEDEQ